MSTSHSRLHPLLTDDEVNALELANDVRLGELAEKEGAAEVCAELVRLGFLKQVFLNEKPFLSITASGRHLVQRIRAWRASA